MTAVTPKSHSEMWKITLNHQLSRLATVPCFPDMKSLLQSSIALAQMDWKEKKTKTS